jgi:hypothetical protein
MSARIYPFPKRQKQESPSGFRDKLTEIEETVDEIVPELLGMLISAGYDVSGDAYVQDVALIVESMKAIMFRSEAMDHGLHKISDRINVTDLNTACANTAR